MTSETDDLEQHLRQNLKLRCELGAAIAKAKAAGSGGAVEACQARRSGLRRGHQTTIILETFGEH
jgi:hypothetical protein